MRARKILPCPGIVYLMTCFLTASAPAEKTPVPPESGALYYINTRTGNDANAGTTPEHPWQSLQRASQCAYVPGDVLHLAAGQTFSGSLILNENIQGTKDTPVTVTSFGEGRATIDGGNESGILLYACSAVRIHELNIQGNGRKNGNNGYGIEVLNARDIEIDHVDVSGFRLSGIAIGGGESIRITHVRAHNNGFAGISSGEAGFTAPHQKFRAAPKVKNLYIGHCTTHDNPGDPKNKVNHSGSGIVAGRVIGGLIEYCESYNNGWDMPRKGNGPVGIWAWGCDNVTIQHCISHNNKTAKGAWDGGGFDFDGGTQNSTMQYNLSYNNHGAGYLFCTWQGAPELWENNTIRFNISINDGLTNHHTGIHCGPNIFNGRFYNNLIVNSRYAVRLQGSHRRGPEAPGFLFRNNIFIAKKSIIEGSFNDTTFVRNLYSTPGGGSIYSHKDVVYTTLSEWTKATGQEMKDNVVVGRMVDYQLMLPETLSELSAQVMRRMRVWFKVSEGARSK